MPRDETIGFQFGKDKTNDAKMAGKYPMAVWWQPWKCMVHETIRPMNHGKANGPRLEKLICAPGPSAC